MKFLRKCRYLGLLPLLVFYQYCSQVNNSKAERNPSDSTRYYTVDDFKSVEKIDAHVHITTEAVLQKERQIILYFVKHL